MDEFVNVPVFMNDISRYIATFYDFMKRANFILGFFIFSIALDSP